jgi:hypothetical protein
MVPYRRAPAGGLADTVHHDETFCRKAGACKILVPPHHTTQSRPSQSTVIDSLPSMFGVEGDHACVTNRNVQDQNRNLIAVDYSSECEQMILD